MLCVSHPNVSVEQGALTHGDRRATETRDLSRFNFDNKVRTLGVCVCMHWHVCLRSLTLISTFPPPLLLLVLSQYGRNALEIVMKSIVNLDSPLVSPPADFDGDFFKGMNHWIFPSWL